MLKYVQVFVKAMPCFFFRLLSNAFSDFGSVGRKKKKTRKNKIGKGVWS